MRHSRFRRFRASNLPCLSLTNDRSDGRGRDADETHDGLLDGDVREELRTRQWDEQARERRSEQCTVAVSHVFSGCQDLDEQQTL